MRTCIPSISARKRVISSLTLLVALMCTSGCASHQLRTPSSDPRHETYESETSNAFFWGLVMSPQKMSADCGDTGFNDVVVERNYLQDLVSVITLGIWMPVSVEYRCRAPHSDIIYFPDSSTQPAGQS